MGEESNALRGYSSKNHSCYSVWSVKKQICDSGKLGELMIVHVLLIMHTSTCTVHDKPFLNQFLELLQAGRKVFR